MSRPLSLLYLHQHFSTPEGAAATRAHAMARALAEAGHRVTLACGRYEGAVTGLSGPFRQGRRQGEVSGFEVVEFDIPCANAMPLRHRTMAFLRFAAAATRLALGRRWDLVIASSTPLTVVLPALAARRLRGTPFLFEMRDPWPELPRALAPLPWPVLPAMERLADAACRRAAAVVALSDGMAETAIARGAARDRLAVIPQGADLDLFGPHVQPWRPESLPEGEVLAVYAGAHGVANGLDLLVDAAAWLRAREAPGPRLLLVGEGGERERLRARASGEGLEDLVHFLEPLPKTQLARLLSGADLGLHCLAPVPEFAEWTAPNKVADYLAAGLPVVTNTPGATARLLERTGSGLSVPPRDAAALGTALAELAQDAPRRRAMARAAQRVAASQLDRRRLAARFVEATEAAAA